MMKAVRLVAPTGVDGLTVEEVERPSPGPDEVLVQVHAAALTRDELNWPVDRLPAIPSYEVSGLALDTGTGVTGLERGQRVFGLTDFDRDGVAAEYAAIPAARLAEPPSGLSHVEAAALPLAGLSAIQGLFDHGRLQPGQRVMINGSGGVGLIAIQLAKIRGAEAVVATSAARVDLARELGADEIVVVRSPGVTGVDPVALVFDTVGGDRLAGLEDTVVEGGRIVSVAERPPPGFGAAKGAEAVFFIVEPNEAQLAELASLADQKLLRVPIDSTFPLHQAREAFERLQSGHAIGKVVLTVDH